MNEKNWNVLTALLPRGWQQMALRYGAVERLRGFSSPDVLLRTLLLHVAQGYSLRETVVRAEMANWADVSDITLLKRLRNSEEWLRALCVDLFRENGVCLLDKAISAPIRIVDGTIVREPGKTGSQWRILYSLKLPSLMCDFFEGTAAAGEGNGESFNRLPVAPHELILADAGYCSIAGIEYVQRQNADVLIRVNPPEFRGIFGTRQAHLSALTIAHSIQSWAVARMAGYLAWSQLLVCGPFVRSTKERSCDSTSAQPPAPQSKQKANGYEAGDVRTC